MSFIPVEVFQILSKQEGVLYEIVFIAYNGRACHTKLCIFLRYLLAPALIFDI